jgi:hypothetical protein
LYFKRKVPSKVNLNFKSQKQKLNVASHFPRERLFFLIVSGILVLGKLKSLYKTEFEKLDCIIKFYFMHILLSKEGENFAFKIEIKRFC